MPSLFHTNSQRMLQTWSTDTHYDTMCQLIRLMRRPGNDGLRRHRLFRCVTNREAVYADIKARQVSPSRRDVGVDV